MIRDGDIFEERMDYSCNSISSQKIVQTSYIKVLLYFFFIINI